ncbi:MAG TPA: acyltransferase family protein [Mycobacteriales bacterium]|nr:acyltransferase family protein [Mycobacteriales bacterium]
MGTAARHRRVSATGRADAGSRSFRPDVEGLRAVAVGVVVAYHAGWGLFSGGFVGVDVFFVLSGFLITGLLVDELTGSGRLSLLGFYARRARRLLPAATVVLVAVAVVFAFVLSPLDRPGLADDLRSAAAYIANWHFAASSLDYMSAPDRSPVLHFWSLGVEEQFYVVWPLLLLLAGARAARRGEVASCRRRVATALGGVFVVSLALSVWQTPRSEPFAYYGLHTRAWELAAGGLLALAPIDVVRRTPRWMRGLSGWMGVVLVLLAATRFDATTVFPGIAAAVPVVGTVLVVASGLDGAPVGTRRMLSAPALRYVGRTSYAWYLWHWPALVLAGDLTVGTAAPDDGTASAPPVAAVLLAVVVSFALAVVTHHLLEDPVRRARWLAAVRTRSLALAASLTTASLGIVTLVLPGGATAASATQVEVVAPQQAPTATASEASRSTLRSTVVHLIESPAQARMDKPHNNRGCYPQYDATTVPSDCQFGDPDGTKVIVLLGDSHAQQWRDSLARQAKDRHWQLWMWAKSECAFTQARTWLTRFHGEYTGCEQWRGKVLQQLATLPRIDLVVVAHAAGYTERLLDARGRKLSVTQAGPVWTSDWAAMAHRLSALTRHIAIIKDNPRPTVDVAACLDQHRKNASTCSPKRNDAMWAADMLADRELAAHTAHTEMIDFDPQICPGNPCPVVTDDGLIMYRDQSHLTATYAMRFSSQLGRRLAALMS